MRMQIKRFIPQTKLYWYFPVALDPVKQLSHVTSEYFYLHFTKRAGAVGWGSGIRRLNLYRGVTSPRSNECPRYVTKSFDGESLVLKN